MTAPNPFDILEAIHPVDTDSSTPYGYRFHKLGLSLHSTRPWIVASTNNGWLTHNVAAHWRRHARGTLASLTIRNYTELEENTTSTIAFSTHQTCIQTTLQTLAMFELVLNTPECSHPLHVLIATVDTRPLGNRVALYNSSTTSSRKPA